MTSQDTDIYQKRYLAHQERKKKELSKLPEKVTKYYPKEKQDFEGVVINRKSRRIFSHEQITESEMKEFLKLIDRVPSSCDRRGVSLEVIEARDKKDLLSGLLVGGAGWINRADKVILLWADSKAYKENLEFMYYLDAGVMVYHLYLMAEKMKFGYCYVNPNIRAENKDFFKKTFGNKIFCGAFAIGKLNY